MAVIDGDKLASEGSANEGPSGVDFEGSAGESPGDAGDWSDDDAPFVNHRDGGDIALLESFVIKNPREGSRHAGKSEPKEVVPSQTGELPGRNREHGEQKHEDGNKTRPHRKPKLAGDFKHPAVLAGGAGEVKPSGHITKASRA